jgi:hypothetical protein
MYQSLFAMLALMITTGLSFSQQQSILQSKRQMVDNELEVMAGSVALHVMEFVGAKAYDERTLPALVNLKGLPTSVAEFSARTAFGDLSTCDLDEPFKNTTGCDDIDDVHMSEDEWQAVPFTMRNGSSIPFEVNVQVYYVNSADLDTPLMDASVTKHKRVAVTVRSPLQAEAGRYVDGLVILERVFSYDSASAKLKASNLLNAAL